MKAAPFSLENPTSVEEATALLAEYGEDAKVLAGGQSLVPLLALRLARYDHLVDLNSIPSLVEIAHEDGWLTVGAMTRQSVAEASAAVAASAPLLHRALPHIGHFQIRNRGTVGGSTAHADPASELPAVALALDAELVVHSGRGRRTILARDFFVSTWTTTLEADELLTAVRYPDWPEGCGFAVEEFARRRGDFAITGVACGVHVDANDKIARAAISLFGMAPTPVRATAAEFALVGQTAGEADLAGIASAAVADTNPSNDLHGTPSFRRRIAAHLTQRALARAIREALDA